MAQDTSTVSQPTTQEPAGEASQPESLSSVMAKCEPDRQLLAADLSPLLRAVWTEALTCIETCLPDFREPGSNDAKLHQMLRNRILNVGNQKTREISQVLRNYAITQVYTREVTVITVNEKPVVPVVAGPGTYRR